MVQVEVIDLNPNQAGGGYVPQRMKMRIRMDHKPGCEFKFIHCLKI